MGQFHETKRNNNTEDIKKSKRDLSVYLFDKFYKMMRKQLKYFELESYHINLKIMLRNHCLHEAIEIILICLSCSNQFNFYIIIDIPMKFLWIPNILTIYVIARLKTEKKLFFQRYILN